jgi:cobalt-precorrin 5A hydrolase/precorrin-3B C17-methyltransferase
VSLICSGDAQIYAMASLVFELLDAEPETALGVPALRVLVEVHPGISAFQAASARAGALLGHDFCCISLSDLLTPRDTIVARLEAAAAADFVTALYNPRSQRRTDLIAYCKSLFLVHRPADTPVVVASRVGRKDEDVQVVSLFDFDPARVDMLTIVLIGSSTSRMLGRGEGARPAAFTPRGYETRR